MLLDLLAMTSGIAPCIKFLCTFDKNLQKSSKIEQLDATWYKADAQGKSDLVVKFRNSRAVENIPLVVVFLLISVSISLTLGGPCSERSGNCGRSRRTRGQAGGQVTGLPPV